MTGRVDGACGATPASGHGDAGLVVEAVERRTEYWPPLASAMIMTPGLLASQVWAMPRESMAGIQRWRVVHAPDQLHR